jgi:hypothetical protein
MLEASRIAVVYKWALRAARGVLFDRGPSADERHPIQREMMLLVVLVGPLPYCAY